MQAPADNGLLMFRLLTYVNCFWLATLGSFIGAFIFGGGLFAAIVCGGLLALPVFSWSEIKNHQIERKDADARHH